MFWRSKPPAAAEQRSNPPANPAVRANGRAPQDSLPSRGPDLDAEFSSALDAIAGFFRVFARYPLAPSDGEARTIAEWCERWATHVLLRTPRPETDADDDEDDARTSGRRETNNEVQRDWLGAVRYVTALRRGEHGHVTKALGDLRQTVWAFIRSLNHALVADGDSDGRMKEQLVRLQTAARGQSTDELRREALAVADTVTEVIEQRKQRQKTQTSEIGARIAALGQALEEARREGALDPLTRLCNRRTFDEELERTVDVAVLLGRRACLLLVDIDHFKPINDNFGHVVGDEVIKRVSESLVRTFRHRDDIVARYGGEEFGVILRDTDPKDAAMLTQRLLETVRTTIVMSGDAEVQCTVSAGIAAFESGESATAWLERTDRALYEAKRQGRNRAVVGGATPVPPGERTPNERPSKRTRAAPLVR